MLVAWSLLCKYTTVVRVHCVSCQSMCILFFLSLFLFSLLINPECVNRVECTWKIDTACMYDSIWRQTHSILMVIKFFYNNYVYNNGTYYTLIFYFNLFISFWHVCMYVDACKINWKSYCCLLNAARKRRWWQKCDNHSSTPMSVTDTTYARTYAWFITRHTHTLLSTTGSYICTTLTHGVTLCTSTYTPVLCIYIHTSTSLAGACSATHECARVRDEFICTSWTMLY